MKKITILAFLGIILYSNAQTNYNFSYFNESYQDLTDAVSLNNGQVWDDPEYTIPFGFDFRISDFLFDTIHIVEWGAGGTLSTSIDYSGLGTEITPIWQDLIDLGHHTGTSASEISYKVEGAEGNKIVKIEWNDAGFWEDATRADYMNFQVWFYESDKSIEYRYGSSSINNPSGSFEGYSGPFVYFIPLGDFDTGIIQENAYILSGNPANPTLIVVEPGEMIDIEDVAFQGMIPDGTVYRFTPTNLSSEDFQDAAVVLYPNPTADYLTVISNTDTFEIALYNSAGQKINHKQVSENRIDVTAIPKGVYFVRIETEKGSLTQKFVKK